MNKITFQVEMIVTVSHKFQCSNCKGTWIIQEWEPSAVRMYCPHCGIVARPEDVDITTDQE